MPKKTRTTTKDPTFELIAAHRTAFEAWEAMQQHTPDDHDDFQCIEKITCGNRDCWHHREYALADVVHGAEERLRTEPTVTLAGLRAKVLYLRGLMGSDFHEANKPGCSEGASQAFLGMITASIDAARRSAR
jgi:hypothetical protein